MPITDFVTFDDPLAPIGQGEGQLGTIAEGINNFGSASQIVGVYGGDGNADVGFVYDGTNYTTLNDPASDGNTDPRGINDAGDIVGFYQVAIPNGDGSFSGLEHGFLYSGGTYTTVEPSAAFNGSRAEGINATGDIVGWYLDEDARPVGYINNQGNYTYLDYPNGVGTYATGINVYGQVAGYYYDGSQYHGFLYSNGTFSDINDPIAASYGGAGTFPTGINDDGDVVGYVLGNFGPQAFVYDPHTHSFTNFSDPSGSEGTYATGINTSMQIVGYYVDSAGAQHGFEATYAMDAPTLQPDGTYKDANGDPWIKEGDGAYWYDNVGNLWLAQSWLASDGFTSSSQTLVSEGSVACYCTGTLIRTDGRQTLVEHLKIGDLVDTLSGVMRPIKWIGRRSYGDRFILGRKDMLPICFKSGSLGDNLPQRDLWISPHHAMYFDGVLIEAKDLVNGTSIFQAEQVDQVVEYFHIELGTHDVIIAEGAFSETFVDDDSRGMFHNAHEYTELYPGDLAPPARYCAPRVDAGYQIEAVRQRITQRAGLVTNHSRVGRLRGFIDDSSAGSVSGWAQNVDYPDAPVCLDIFCGNRLIGQTLANSYREDLDQAGLGGGCYAFEFRLPADVGFELRSVEVRRSLDGAKLEMSKAWVK